MSIEYISRRDLRSLGFLEPDSTFDTLVKQVNDRVAQIVEQDLKAEIQANHNHSDQEKYIRLLNQYGFGSTITQEWLRQHIPALHQIELECREMVLHDLRAKTQQKT